MEVQRYQKSALNRQFEGMTSEPFSYKEYEQVKAQLVQVISESLTDTDKDFLLGFKGLTPRWELYPYGDFPSVRWKLQHLEKLRNENPDKHNQLYELLKSQLKVHT